VHQHRVLCYSKKRKWQKIAFMFLIVCPVDIKKENVKDLYIKHTSCHVIVRGIGIHGHIMITASWLTRIWTQRHRAHAQMAYPTVMSKMLEPTELDTAISPSPLRATITLVMRSGMEVPAANIVRPIISSVIPMVCPTWEKKRRKKGN